MRLDGLMDRDLIRLLGGARVGWRVREAMEPVAAIKTDRGWTEEREQPKAAPEPATFGSSCSRNFFFIDKLAYSYGCNAL